MSAGLSQTRREVVEATGRLWQMLGLPRSTGQIYGLLYLAPKPLPLDDIAELLGISKASASTGTRQLVAWQALRQVWVPGERRDHFEAMPELREVLQAGYHALFKPKLERTGRKVERLLETLEEERRAGVVAEAEYRFCKSRLKEVSALQTRMQRLLPLAEKLM
jgi:HTH-type transcriptional regulator, glycine betaine synthesis regulator